MTLPGGIAAATVLDRLDWADLNSWQGEIEGAGHGVGLSLILNDFGEAGRGPNLHRHDYAETIIVLSGKAKATIGNETKVIEAGQILFLPAGVAHGFKSLAGGPFRSVDIHENASFVTEWLEEDGRHQNPEG